MSRRWRLAPILIGGAVVAGIAGVNAQADDGGGGGGVAVGGTVASVIALSIGAPTAFTKIATRTYQMTIPVQVTSTETVTILSIADGEDPTGPAHGRLRTAKGHLPTPLQVGLVGGGLSSLAAPFDPTLVTWRQPLAQTPSTIAVRQQLAKGSITSPSLHKVLLVTVSSQKP